MLKQLGTWAVHLIWFALLLVAYLVNSLLLQIATDAAHRSPATAEHYIFLTIITGAGPRRHVHVDIPAPATGQ